MRSVKDAKTGERLADHLWFNRGNLWRQAGLTRGDIIQFEARVTEYRCGHWGPNRLLRAEQPPRVDYKLTPPKRLIVIGHREPWKPVA